MFPNGSGIPDFASDLGGFAVGAAVDLTGQASQRGDTVVSMPTPEGSQIELLDRAGTPLAISPIASGSTDGLQFLALPDAGHGTDLIAPTTSGLRSLAADASSEFGGGSLHAVVMNAVHDLASGGQLASSILGSFGVALGSQVGTFLQDEAKTHTAATIQAVQDLFSKSFVQVPVVKARGSRRRMRRSSAAAHSAHRLSDFSVGEAAPGRPLRSRQGGGGRRRYPPS